MLQQNNSWSLSPKGMGKLYKGGERERERERERKYYTEWQYLKFSKWCKFILQFSGLLKTLSNLKVQAAGSSIAVTIYVNYH